MNTTALVGNLTQDPKLSYSSGEKRTAIARFSIAVNEGQGENAKAHFVNVTTFGTLAENVADTLRKGMRVVAVARLDTYPKPVEIDGQEKNLTMVSFIASAIGPDLRWAVAKVARVERDAEDGGENRAASTNSHARNGTPDHPDGTEARTASRSTARARATAPAPEDDDF